MKALLNLIFVAIILCANSIHAQDLEIPFDPSAFSLSSPQARANQVIEISAEDIHLKINHDWVGGVDGGYWPVRINLINRGPECIIEFRAVPQDGSYRSEILSGAIVKKRVDARQNVENDVLLLIPSVSPNTAYVLEVRKNGQHLDNLDTSMNLANDFRFSAKDVISCALIAQGPDDLLKFSQLAKLCNIEANYGHIELSGLPGNWLAFSTLDLLVISESDFEQELTDQQKRALLNWVRVGGTLIVHEAHNFSPESTERLDQLLDLNLAAAVSSQWHGAGSDFLIGEANQLMTSQTVERYRNTRNNYTREPLSTSTNWKRNSFATRGYYFGQIIGLRDNFFDAADADFLQLNLDIDFASKNWAGTHGISTRRGGHDFYKFVMQGIRVIPTYAYITLITVFCLLIGPVNYIYLYYKQRITMILWTIPIIALLGTVLLISYTTIASGFTTKSRIRSVTLLDQNQQTSVSMTRVGFFPGRTPPKGMAFNADTAVYPVWPYDNQMNNGEIDWTDSQQLDRSWLPARIRTQFLLQNIRNERGRVTLEGSGSEGKFVNGLEWTIRKAIVCDENGDSFYVENVMPGKSVKFTKLTESRSDAFKQVIEDQLLQSPVSYEDINPRSRNYYYSRRSPRDLRSTNYSSNVGEQQLSWLKRTQLHSTELKPNSYIAILAEDPGINVGIENHNTVEELHLLFGFL